jgi:hypothetical protein
MLVSAVLMAAVAVVVSSFDQLQQWFSLAVAAAVETVAAVGTII